MDFAVGDYVYWIPPAGRGESKPEIMQVAEILQPSETPIKAIWWSDLPTRPSYVAGQRTPARYTLVRDYYTIEAWEHELRPLPPLMQLALQAKEQQDRL